MTLKYLNLTGLNALVSAMKTWVLSRIPTKTSELTNDANFITSNDLPTNHVTTDTTQTITSQKTWTAEQTFSLPIVGSIAGTASKAIADEDGTSIKTGYVNVAGNQTVTGQKTWSDTQSFKDSAYTQGVTVTDRKQNIWKVTDSTDTAFGTWEAIQYTNGKQGFRLCTANKYKNGTLDPTGNIIPVYFEFLQRPVDGATILKWTNGFIDNSVYPLVTNTHTLGNASYQWSSVYAQTYYYNGTAWGLDKANVWSGNNRFQALSVSSTSTIDITQSTLPSATTSANFSFNDNGGRYWGAIRTQVQTDRSNILKFIVSNWKTNGTQGTTELDFFYDANLDKKSFFPSSNNVDLGTSTNKWKTLNGINPGALSLPDYSSNKVEPIDFSQWNISGGLQNSYTPDIDGWLGINIVDAATNSIFVYTKLGIPTNDQAYCASIYGNGSQGLKRLGLMIPVRASITYGIVIKASSVNDIDFARFYPALGNV